jgi:hypothetical protein
MSEAISATSTTNAGVEFSVRVESANHGCLITHEALVHLSGRNLAKAEAEAVFRAFEAKIAGIARRQIHAGVGGKPLVLGPAAFP